MSRGKEDHEYNYSEDDVEKKKRTKALCLPLPIEIFAKHRKNTAPRFCLAGIPSLEAMLERGFNRTYFWINGEGLQHIEGDYFAAHLNSGLYYRAEREAKVRIQFSFEADEIIVSKSDLRANKPLTFIKNWFKTPSEVKPQLPPNLTPAEDYLVVRAMNQGFFDPVFESRDHYEFCHQVIDFPEGRVAYCLTSALESAAEVSNQEDALLLNLNTLARFTDYPMVPIAVMRLGGQWYYCQENYLKHKPTK